jgi:hypothetical protein
MLKPSIKNSLRSPLRSLLKTLVVAVALAIGSSASFAALPGTIKPGHPRLYTSSAGLDALKSQLTIMPANFTSDGGSVSFEFKPSSKSAGDLENSGLFGSYDSGKNTIFVRYIDSKDTASKATIQIALLQNSNPASYVAVNGAEVSLDQWSSVTVSWDSTARTVSAKVNGVPLSMTWRSDAGNWKPEQQIYSFTPRKNDAVRNISVLNKNRTEVAHFATLDVPLNRAWSNFVAVADSAKAVLAACGNTPVDPGATTICNVATGHRILITDAAQQLALAYRMTGDVSYLNAAQTFINRMLSVPLATGTEWTQGGRVGAMAILYDWLYAELGTAMVPNDPQQRSYRTAMAQTIKATIAAKSSRPSDDLNNAICGAQLLKNTSTEFDCAVKPVYEGWNRYGTPLQPSISGNYITGHQHSAVTEIALGLLAIGDEYPEVMPMLDTAWTHFEKGFMAARAQLSVDGGHPNGYAYGIGPMPERVLMWRNALNTNAPLFQDDWQAKLVYPYIYGLRSDNSYPARGDDFGKSVWEYDVGYLALWAAANGNDGSAMSFYKNVAVPARTSAYPMVLERLYWPLTTQETPLGNLELSRHFRVAGSVVMRDSWDFANATLLDFKSSNLATENHQHLDQNSFSLYYKAPLLLDSGSYDEYASPHWHHYFTRSVAHNTITVFDPNERFIKYGTEYSNDGGQWYPSVTYPTLEEIKPGASNYLDGVSTYESGHNFTLVTGNASKAYSSVKLNQSNGFLRTVAFLPAPKFWQKPVTVVFDSVRVTGTQAATFVLHPGSDPVADVAAQSAGNGQYTLPFADNAARQFTIRNGAGMLTAQTLLPQNAKVAKIGGTSGSSCSQIDASSGTNKGTVNGNCAFTVRERQTNGTFVWRNYPIRSNSARVSPEMGAWRLEMTTPDAVVAGSTQYFLNVFSVADNDGASSMAAAPATQRLSADANTEAVLLGNSTIVAFNRGTAPLSTMSWLAPGQNLALLLSGLKANTDFVLSIVAEGGGYRYTVQETVGGAYHSSAQGILSLNL